MPDFHHAMANSCAICLLAWPLFFAFESLLFHRFGARVMRIQQPLMTEVLRFLLISHAAELALGALTLAALLIDYEMHPEWSEFDVSDHNEKLRFVTWPVGLVLYAFTCVISAKRVFTADVLRALRWPAVVVAVEVGFFVSLHLPLAGYIVVGLTCLSIPLLFVMPWAVFIIIRDERGARSGF